MSESKVTEGSEFFLPTKDQKKVIRLGVGLWTFAVQTYVWDLDNDRIVEDGDTAVGHRTYADAFDDFIKRVTQ